MFRLPDFALGALVAGVLATAALLFAFPNNPDNWILWAPLLAGVVIASAGAGILWDQNRFNVAMVLVSALTGMLIAMQIAEMRKVYGPIASQADALQTQIKEMRLEQRAWVSLTSAKISEASRDVNGIRLGFQYSVENSGRNPASNVSLNVELYILIAFGKISDTISQETKLCQPPIANDNLGVSLFPRQTLPDLNFVTYLRQTDIANFEAQHGRTIASLPIVVLGCLSYKDAVDQTWHGTPAAFDIINVWNGGFGGVPFDNQTLSTAHLNLRPYPFEVAPPF